MKYLVFASIALLCISSASCCFTLEDALILIDKVTESTSNLDIITLYSGIQATVLERSVQRLVTGFEYSIVVKSEDLSPQYVCIKITKDLRGVLEVRSTVKKVDLSLAKKECGFL